MFTVKLKLLHIASLFYFFVFTLLVDRRISGTLGPVKVSDWPTDRPTDRRILNKFPRWIPRFIEVRLYCLHRQVDVYSRN